MARILIADDDEDVVRFLSTALEAEGYETAAAEDVSAAVKSLRSEKVDLLILDIGLPGTEGQAPAQIVRGAVDGAPRILILTGRDLRREVPRGTLKGADASLEKGCSLDKLMGTVKRLLRKSPA